MNSKQRQDQADESQVGMGSYGNFIVGIWLCKCGYFCFPRELHESRAKPPFICPRCDAELIYDEEE
jgi:hypothetical protein